MTAHTTPVTAENENAVADALRDASRSRSTARLCGSGSWQHLLPPTDGVRISTASMNKVVRLDPQDLTCSVEPGVTYAQLADALAPHRLLLPCAAYHASPNGEPGSGSLGGLFAMDPIGAVAPRFEPRALLLGLRAVLADGTAFKCGAKVVKSVAGFDIHKLFVGSAGRLFAATELHLKLRPMPRARAGFAFDVDHPAAAWAALGALSRQPSAPVALAARLTSQGARIEGTVEGATTAVKRAMQALRGTYSLQEQDPDGAWQGVVHAAAPPPANHGLLIAQVEWATSAATLASLDSSVAATLTPSGRLFASGPEPAIRALQLEIRSTCPDGGRADILSVGGHRDVRGDQRLPERRRSTQLEDELRTALDPQRTLT